MPAGSLGNRVAMFLAAVVSGGGSFAYGPFRREPADNHVGDLAGGRGQRGWPALHAERVTGLARPYWRARSSSVARSVASIRVGWRAAKASTAPARGDAAASSASRTTGLVTFPPTRRAVIMLGVRSWSRSVSEMAGGEHRQRQQSLRAPPAETSSAARSSRNNDALFPGPMRR